MSWSIAFIGKRDNVLAALKAHTTKLTGASLKEYESALPDLMSLVEKNIGDQVLSLRANGHAVSQDKGDGNGLVTSYSQCYVDLSQLNGVLV